jgi:hypothetical protein
MYKVPSWTQCLVNTKKNLYSVLRHEPKQTPVSSQLSDIQTEVIFSVHRPNV